MSNNLSERSSYYIGYSTDKDIRFNASSGGVGTAIIKYLLSTPDYDTSITFFFDKEKCAYDVKLIHSFEEYNNCGSIYQDINIALFIKKNISRIKGGMVVCCPPCQVAAIRGMLDKAKIKNFIISFCCSGQTTIEGTWCYYKFLGINKEDVAYMQYRGNGWPSGIQIELKDGRKIYHDNYTEPWVTIHRSLLFRPKRCLYCKLDTGWNADVSIADPWLPQYKGLDKIGHTFFISITKQGKETLSYMIESNILSCNESSYDEYAIAQDTNIRKVLLYKDNRRYKDWLSLLIVKKKYREWAMANIQNMRKHQKIIFYMSVCSSFSNFRKYLSSLCAVN